MEINSVENTGKERCDAFEDQFSNGRIRGSVHRISSEDQFSNGRIRTSVHRTSSEDQFSNGRIRASVHRISSEDQFSNETAYDDVHPSSPIRRHPDIDGGWAWVVFVCCFFTFSITGGLLYTNGIFYSAMLQEFGHSYSYTAWMGSLFSAFFMLGGPVASWFIGQYGCRSGMFVASALMASGYIISAFAHSLETVLVAYGVIVATGMCFAYSSVVLVLNEYFVDRHALATSITMTGNGLGLFCFSQILDWVAKQEGWQFAFLFCAGVSLQVCVLGASFFPLPLLTEDCAPIKMAAERASDPFMQLGSPHSKTAAGPTIDVFMQHVTCEPEMLDPDSENCSADLKGKNGINKEKSDEQVSKVRIEINENSSARGKSHQIESIDDENSAMCFEVPTSINNEVNGGQELSPSREEPIHRGKHWIHNYLKRSGSYVHMSASAAYLSQCSALHKAAVVRNRPRVYNHRQPNSHSFSAFGVYDNLVSKKVLRHPALQQRTDSGYRPAEKRHSSASTENAHIKNFRERFKLRSSNPSRPMSLSNSRHTLDGGKVLNYDSSATSLRRDHKNDDASSGIIFPNLKTSHGREVTSMDEENNIDTYKTISPRGNDNICKISSVEEKHEQPMFQIAGGNEDLFQDDTDEAS